MQVLIGGPRAMATGGLLLLSACQPGLPCSHPCQWAEAETVQRDRDLDEREVSLAGREGLVAGAH